MATTDTEKFIKVFPSGMDKMQALKESKVISFSDIGKLMFLSMYVQKDTGLLINNNGASMNVSDMSSAIGDSRQNFHKTLKAFIDNNIILCVGNKYFINPEYATDTCSPNDTKFTVYRFVDSGGSFIYIGKSKNGINTRMSQHMSNGHLPKECYDNIDYIEYISVPTKLDMDILEKYYIGKYEPKWNDVDSGYGVTMEIIDNYVWHKYS